MLNVAVIGTGTLGKSHVANFAQIDGCQVRRVYDVVAEAAQECSEQVGAEVASDAKECYADDIDVVVVTTPTSYHAEYCVQAAQAGKHIFCEKPMTRTVEQGEEIMAAVAEAGVTMTVGHVVRLFPEYAQATKMIKSGELGKIGMVRMTRINTMPRGSHSWFQDFEASGGVFLDMSIHDVDWLLWTFGKPERIYMKGLWEHMPKLDYALCTLRFPDGTIAHVEGSWADLGLFRTNFEITGSEGLLAHDSTANVTLTVQKRATEGTGAAEVQVPASPAYKSPYLMEDELFIEALQTGGPPPVSVSEALEAVKVALAGLQSAQTGEVVEYQ